MPPPLLRVCSNLTIQNTGQDEIDCGPKIFSMPCLENVTELDHPWKEYIFCYKTESTEERGALQIKYSPAATEG